MSEVIGHLKPVEGTNYVTHKDARTQIREICKMKNLEVGTFLPRKNDHSAITIPLSDGSGVVTSKRAVGAEILIVKTVAANEISPELLAQIEADGKRGDHKRATLLT